MKKFHLIIQAADDIRLVNLTQVAQHTVSKKKKRHLFENFVFDKKYFRLD